jgi:small neutral amino acid transporter SnatA (MarC family)
VHRVVRALAAHVDNAAAYLGMIINRCCRASVTLFFVLGVALVRRPGPSAVGAINKIFGFLMAIAVQLVWNGVAGLPRVSP